MALLIDIPAMPGAPTLLATLPIGPVQFDAPHFLVLAPILWLAAWWMGRRSLAGLGSVTRWVALAVRLGVIGLLCATLAEPQWRQVSKDVAVTLVVDVSQSVPQGEESFTKQYIERAVEKGRESPNDRLGVVTTAREAFVQALPSKLTTLLETQHTGILDATNLAAGLRLAMAVRPTDAANRILLATDGNETAGSLLSAAEAAKAAGVPIDVLPLRYKYEGEVIVDRLISPATARFGENVSLKIALQATRPARGRLSILLNGDPIDLDPDSPAFGTPVELAQGLNVLTQTVKPPRDGPAQFEAVFEPELVNGKARGDAIAENNRSSAVTFVVAEAKVLVVREGPEESEALERVLTESKIAAHTVNAAQAPASLTEMAGYDAIVLVNEPSYNFSQKQQEDLKQYVHDSGGGLVMIGGKDSFGAGGWIGSPLEDALPIRLDPPQERQMPRGALALVLHSVELPEGVYYGKKVCEAAVEALSRLDYIGINEYSWGGGGTSWVLPLQLKGDGSVAKRAIQKLNFGDMPDFSPSLEMTYRDMMKLDAGQRHCIVISDGDPAPPLRSLLQKFVDAKITITTVGMATHSAGDVAKMKWMSETTGGRHYEVPPGQAATLPQIFIKEAQTVKRSLIWEGPAFSPPVVDRTVESMRGIGGAMPGLTGYVVAADREGLSQVVMRAKGKDPLLAMWQYGLGKSVAFTSEANPRWAAAWIGWPGFKAFWEQQVRWAMRPAGSPNVKVMTESKGDQTTISVQMYDSKGQPQNFANIIGHVVQPDGTVKEITLPQAGPGRYEITVPTAASGSYLASFIWGAPGEKEGEVLKGSMQAAINRPFADEYRTLEDNEPLLKQVAQMTGGRVLKGDDPAVEKLWLRDGLTMPVALRPVWLWAALIAMGLFLIDVGVRRVRIEPAMIAAAVRRVFSPAKAAQLKQMEGLRSAREKAQARMATSGPGAQGAAPRTGPAPEAVKSVKFEASAEAKARVGTDVGLEKIAVEGGTQKPAPTAAAQDKDKSKDAQGDLGALLKAKKRARSEMDEQ